MASFGHIAVGMAAARIYQRQPAQWPWVASAVTWSALSMLPDADVIGFAFGVRYEDTWGHRGATHSLVFSLALGLAIAIGARWFRLRAVRTGLLAGGVLASHAVLDTLTNGGLGCALFWPFDRTRYFAPWNPIPVSPIGLYFFSTYGLTVALTEVVLFAPVWGFAIWPQLGRVRSRATALLCIWLEWSGSWAPVLHFAMHSLVRSSARTPSIPAVTPRKRSEQSTLASPQPKSAISLARRSGNRGSTLTFRIGVQARISRATLWWVHHGPRARRSA